MTGRACRHALRRVLDREARWRYRRPGLGHRVDIGFTRLPAPVPGASHTQARGVIAVRLDIPTHPEASRTLGGNPIIGAGFKNAARQLLSRQSGMR